MGEADSDYTPEQQAIIIKRMIENAVEFDKARKSIDRANAIRDGLIPPLWMDKAKPKPVTNDWQQRYLTPVFSECWPPKGQVPTDLTNNDIVKKAGDAYQKRYGGRGVGRNTILRKAGRLRPK